MTTQQLLISRLKEEESFTLEKFSSVEALQDGVDTSVFSDLLAITRILRLLAKFSPSEYSQIMSDVRTKIRDSNKSLASDIDSLFYSNLIYILAYLVDDIPNPKNVKKITENLFFVDIPNNVATNETTTFTSEAKIFTITEGVLSATGITILFGVLYIKKGKLSLRVSYTEDGSMHHGTYYQIKSVL